MGWVSMEVKVDFLFISLINFLKRLEFERKNNTPLVFLLQIAHKYQQSFMTDSLNIILNVFGI